MLFIIDPGHGGIIDGKYMTAGKRSPKLPDGSVLYEGVNNRINARLIVDALEEEGLNAKLLVDSNEDVALGRRVVDVNWLAQGEECVLISIHSDAAGNGVEFHPAKGFSAFHYTNASAKSKRMANIIQSELKTNLGSMSKDRGVRSANFYLLRKTNCPAVLLELGFHTNLEEVQKMQTLEWRQAVVKSVVNACKSYLEI